jgi:hypothetical protein
MSGLGAKRKWERIVIALDWHLQIQESLVKNPILANRIQAWMIPKPRRPHLDRACNILNKHMRHKKLIKDVTEGRYFSPIYMWQFNEGYDVLDTSYGRETDAVFQ